LLEAYGGSVVPLDVAAAALAGMQRGRQADRATLANWFTSFMLSQQGLAAAVSG